MQTDTQNLYIITGGPGAGKTTLINALAACGFQTAEEEARKIIRQQIAANGQALPWRDKGLYASLMLKASKDSYHQIVSQNRSSPVFFDRGIIDSICYMTMENIPLSDERNRISRKYLYNRLVFMLPPWKDIYATDPERKQSWAEAQNTYEQMKKTYEEYGYHTIDVPKSTIEERVTFIMKKTGLSIRHRQPSGLYLV